MAETQDASVGYMGEVWLHNGTTLYELVQVKSFQPGTAERERVDASHLKTPNWRRQQISTWYGVETLTVTLNYRPLSDTQTLLEDALNDADERVALVVYPENGVPVAQRDYTLTLISLQEPEVAVDQVMEVVAVFEVASKGALEAYVS